MFFWQRREVPTNSVEPSWYALTKTQNLSQECMACSVGCQVSVLKAGVEPLNQRTSFPCRRLGPNYSPHQSGQAFTPVHMPLCWLMQLEASILHCFPMACTPSRGKVTIMSVRHDCGSKWRVQGGMLGTYVNR